MLCYFVLYSKMIQLYMSYTLFFIFFSIMIYRMKFLVLHSRTLLFVHPIYNSLHLLIPNYQFIPPPPLSLGNHKFVSVSVSLFLSHK